MKRATKSQAFLDASRDAHRLRRRIKDGRRFVSVGHRKSIERTLRYERALEYVLSPGNPTLYHDQEAMADVLRTIKEMA